MATNVRLIKGRIKSAGNIAKITRAMQMVAASKMKKAQTAAVSGRPYAEKIAEMVVKFAGGIDPNRHPLLKVNQSGKTLLILISTNKGLLGGLNTNLFRAVAGWYAGNPAKREIVNVTMGKKGENFLVRTGKSLAADFSSSTPFGQHTAAISEMVTAGYAKSEFKEVYVAYSNFISALKQEPVIKQILPLTDLRSMIAKNQGKDAGKTDFIVEPGLGEILDPLLVSYVENQIRDAIYEAEASEHSARMIAMKNATDNARELMELLTLEYNKARQEKITYEIADIVTARIAVKD